MFRNDIRFFDQNFFVIQIKNDKTKEGSKQQENRGGKVEEGGRGSGPDRREEAEEAARRIATHEGDQRVGLARPCKSNFQPGSEYHEF